MNNLTKTHKDEWRCPTCGTLLGVGQDGQIEIRYKTASYIVVGELSTRCRRCNTPSNYTTERSIQPEAVPALDRAQAAELNQ